MLLVLALSAVCLSFNRGVGWVPSSGCAAGSDGGCCGGADRLRIVMVSTRLFKRIYRASPGSGFMAVSSLSRKYPLSALFFIVSDMPAENKVSSGGIGSAAGAGPAL